MVKQRHFSKRRKAWGNYLRDQSTQNRQSEQKKTSPGTSKNLQNKEKNILDGVKTCKTKFLIGWEDGPSFTDQSQSIVNHNKYSSLITYNSQVRAVRLR